jgi:hypothetical protein
MEAASYKTYAIHRPLQTHWRQGTCAEKQCRGYTEGWKTRIDESTELGQGQAYYIRKESGRSFTEERDEAGLTVFTFEAGQQCFRPAKDHMIEIGKPELYVVRGGDWRGNPRKERRRHFNGDDWVDDFANHQDRLATRLSQG